MDKEALLQKIAPTCPICNESIRGTVVQDFWGNIYCARHELERPHCEYCGRLVIRALTGGGLEFPDSRVICNLCLKTAIYLDETARPRIEGVGQWLLDRGMNFGSITLAVRLMQVPELERISKHTGTSLLGVTFRQEIPTYQGPPIRRVSGIGLLWGLPQVVFEGVAAHELGHAWLFVNHIESLEAWGEEGFCNLLMYQWFQQIGTREAEYQMWQLETRPDPLYGDGFRKVRQLFDKYNLDKLIEYLLTHHTLPQ